MNLQNIKVVVAFCSKPAFYHCDQQRYNGLSLTSGPSIRLKNTFLFYLKVGPPSRTMKSLSGQKVCQKKKKGLEMMFFFTKVFPCRMYFYYLEMQVLGS